jgi:uncharacterized protein YoxC
MQKIISARRLSAAVAVAAFAASGIAASPAMAKTTKPLSNKALTRQVTLIKTQLASAAKVLKTDAAGLQASINTLTTGLATTNGKLTALTTTVANLSSTVSGLSSALASGGTTVTNALTAINTALNDSSTGLVGLNTARPRFAVVAGAAGGFAIVGNTPEHTPTIAYQTTGQAVINFGEDVSSRALVVTTAPDATAPFAQAVDCKNAAAAGSPCPATSGTDSSASDVLVTVENFPGPAPANKSFTITALAG